MGRNIRHVCCISLMVFAFSAMMIALAQSPSELRRRHEAVREVSVRADSGDAEALYQLALLHERGYDSIPKDSTKALLLLREAADAGFPAAANLLGYKLITGEGGIERNPAEGLGLLEDAAAHGDPKALSNLGYLLLYGEGVEHDSSKAAYWLQRASEGGILSASSMLGDLYRDGEGVDKDSLKAASLYRMAFDKGLTDAGYKLYDLTKAEIDTLPARARLTEGLYYFNRSLPSVGVDIFRSLAEDSSVSPELRAHSKALLGDAYSRGRGVGYDYELSTRYYLEAAREGDPSAQFIIGEMLQIFPDALEGKICADDPADINSAYYWLDRAAGAGVTDASTAIRRLHDYRGL